MAGQLKPYYHKTSKRWVVSINRGKHPDGRRNRKYFYGRTPEQAIAAAHGARSPDRVVAICKIQAALERESRMSNRSRALLCQAIAELEENL